MSRDALVAVALLDKDAAALYAEVRCPMKMGTQAGRRWVKARTTKEGLMSQQACGVFENTSMG